MSESGSIFEKGQTSNNTPRESNSENKKDIQIESDYLNIFCKDISKINNRDECGWTPLYRTVVSGILNATEYLLNNGADPNIQTSMGETPLYQAVEMEKISHVNLLLQKGANPNISQIDGMSPLHLAVNRQNILIIKELLKSGADPNNKTILYNQTPVHFAIKNNVDPMILLILVQYNGSLFIKDKFEKTPLDYISSEEMRKVIEKLKLENKEETNKKIINNTNTPSKESNWSDSKNLSDSLNLDNHDEEKKIIFKENIVLKEPGVNIFQYYNKARSGTIGNENEFNNIRKNLFENKYRKKIINKSFSNNSKKGNKINDSCNYTNEEISNDISNNLRKDNCIRSKKERIKNKFKNIPNNYFSSMKKGEENDSSDEKQIEIKYLSNMKNKNNFINDKDNKSTCFNSENSSNNKNENNLRRGSRDYNTIAEIKKFCLNKRESRNHKILSNFLSQKNPNYEASKSFLDSKTINYSETIDSINKSINSVLINDYKNKKYNKLYRKPRVSMNESNIDKNNSGYTLNIINNNTINNKNFFNNSNRASAKTISSSAKNLNLLNDQKNKGPLKLKKLKFQKKVFNEKFTIPFDKKKLIPYSIRNTYNSNRNTYNTINSSHNDSFSDMNFSQYIHKKNSTTLSICDSSIIIEPEKYPILEWLNEINLSCYSSLFIQKKIYDIQKIINTIKKGKIKITPKDIYKIGITIPGHIYRIFVKLELDSGIIDKKIMEIIENKKYGTKNEEINILNNSIYNLCGCCSLKERSRSTFKKKKDNAYEIEQWLIDINMIKYKQNFIENGFDKFEYFFLQMFGNFPIDSNILKDSIGITNEKDRDLILLQLQKEVKYLTLKSRNAKKISTPKTHKKYEAYFNEDSKDSQECRII